MNKKQPGPTYVEPGCFVYWDLSLTSDHGAQMVSTVLGVVAHIIETIDKVHELVNILEIEIHGVEFLVQLILEIAYVIAFGADLAETGLGAVAIDGFAVDQGDGRLEGRPEQDGGLCHGVEQIDEVLLDSLRDGDLEIGRAHV